MSSANVPSSISAAEQQLLQLTEALKETYDSGGTIPDQLLQQLLTVSVKLYVGKLEQEQRFPPFTENEVTATDVVMTVCEMLDYAGLELFELGMWRSSRKSR